MTASGLRQVKELIDKGFTAILNGEKWNTSEFFSTGKRPVYKLKTEESFKLRLTEDHKVLKVKQLTETGLKLDGERLKILKMEIRLF